MEKAVFLDRDGVLNYLVFNQKTNEYEAPHNPNDYKLYPNVIESLKILLELGYKLFVVSNQPDYAKGKTSLESLKLVHQKMHSDFTENNIKLTDYYYCYHHPSGTIPEYSIVCKCRKPENFFLKQAQVTYNLDLTGSWMIGDRDSDIYCGQSMGLKTVMISVEHSANNALSSQPDYKVANLKEAVEIIKKQKVLN